MKMSTDPNDVYFNCPTTALLSKSQSIRLKEYAQSQGVSVSKILRQYVDIICPPPASGWTRESIVTHENYHNKAIKDIMDTIIPDAIRNRVDWKNSPTIGESYWCRVCSDHVDTYTEGEDIKCKTCNNYVVGG
jgi:hypothetical protein